MSHNPFQETLREFLLNFSSPHTRISYEVDLQQFFQFLFERDPTIKVRGVVERTWIIEYRHYLGDI